MKRCLLLLCSLCCLSSFAQTAMMLPSYNGDFYPSVLPAAKGVAMPFLIMEGYEPLAGATVADSVITYSGIKYVVHNNYINPSTPYYLPSGSYSSYGVTGFSAVWPVQMPNIMFDSSDTSFNSQSDCVGYLTRVLSATGDTTASGNAYMNIINLAHAANIVPFAHRGYVATAYSFAVAFPTLPTSVTTGWEYISGNMITASVDTYDLRIVPGLAAYSGVRKGGFANAFPGDILAFGYSASSSSNGHVMVMETAPQLLTSGELSDYFPPAVLSPAAALQATHNIYAVPVFDCSGVTAHFRDSRTLQSGIGHGTLLVLTALTDDAPTGFIFDSTEVMGGTINLMDTLGPQVYAISVGRFASPALAVGSDVSPNEPLKIFPNPASDYLQILLPGNGDGTLTIRSMDGKIVFRQNAHTSLSLPVAQWIAGLYIITYQPADRGASTSATWIKQ